MRKLLGLGALAFVPVDAPDDAIRVLELVDRVLKLIIEHGPVRHHDDRVEHLLALIVVERRELVGGPGDGVGLAGPRTVLGEILVARAYFAAGLDQPGDQIPLVIAGEDEGFLLGLASVPSLLRLDLQVDEAPDDLEDV